MRSSAIQSVQNGSEKAARPPEGCPAEAGGLFGPESALGFDHPSGTNARRPGQKAEERSRCPMDRYVDFDWDRLFIDRKSIVRLGEYIFAWRVQCIEREAEYR